MYKNVIAERGWGKWWQCYELGPRERVSVNLVFILACMPYNLLLPNQ